MNKKYVWVLLLICGALFVFFSYLLPLCLDAHWEKYRISEYEFRDAQIQSDFSNWLDTLVYQYNTNDCKKQFEDFDFCYQPYIDYVWDSLNMNAVDSFNVRLHTHSYENNYLRPSWYAKSVIGVCCVNSHLLYLYDNHTINRFFCSKNKKKNIHRLIPNNHGFLDWRDEEVWLAYSNEYLRTLSTSNVRFNRLEYLFYHTIDFTDKLQFIPAVNRDSFCVRTSGPYLRFSINDKLNRETTRENLRQFLSKQISKERIEKMTEESCLYFACKVDTLGQVVVENVSSKDMRTDADRMIQDFPTFLPAMESGMPVNSLVFFRFVKYDFTNIPETVAQ